MEEDASALPLPGSDRQNPLQGSPQQPNWGGASSLDPNQVQWRTALPVAALAGLICGGVSLFVGRFVFLLVVLLMVEGAITVKLYRRRVPAVVRPMAGAKLGAFAGLFSFLLYALMVVGMFTLGRPLVQQSLRDAMSVSSRNIDPQTMKTMQTLIDQMNTPEGLATLCVLVVVILFGVAMVFSALGGVLGATLWGKDHPSA
jgi:hypothetical protein